jgi:pimeloyl-ACP methyl ester carboxylesterase
MSDQKHVLMIHGLLGSINYFSPQSHLLDMVVHTPDLIGYGRQIDAASHEVIDLHLQAETIARFIDERIGEPVWLLGHSVGGAVAMLAAALVPHRIAGLISVEGNFTLNDAFWCARIAATPEQAWAEEYRVMRADPTSFLTRGAIAPTPERLAWAETILANQPHATVQSMARSVIQETGASGYLDLVRAQIERGTAIYLLAGERSAAEWDVPDWVRTAARQDVVMPATGHMMMMEDPAGFCRTVRAMMDDATSAPAATVTAAG